LDSRHARDRLKPRAKPYFKQLIPGLLHLGYRRRGSGRGAQGSWLVRLHIGKRPDGGSPYKEHKLGFADDFRDADGNKILDYAQAQKRALEWSDKSDGNREAPSGPSTVAGIIQNYITGLEHEGRPAAAKFAQKAANLHILPVLGAKLVNELSASDYQRWLHNTAEKPAHVRRKKLDTAPAYRRTREADDPAEAKRRRQATALRTWTVFRAALNAGFRDGKIASDASWRKVRLFKGTDVARLVYLTVDESQRLVNAATVEFRPVIVAALYTGARHSEIANLRCRDFDVDANTLVITRSKSGRPRHVPLSDEAAKFFREISVGRPPAQLMFVRANGQPWGKGSQDRPMHAACTAARIDPPISFHILRHSYASQLVQNGAPLNAVQELLGHSSSRMTQRYAHLAPSYVADVVKKTAPLFGFTKSRSKVVPL
jgi:integrase